MMPNLDCVSESPNGNMEILRPYAGDPDSRDLAQGGTCVFLNTFEFGFILSTSQLVICIEPLPCAILLQTYVCLYNYACPLICVIESHMPLPHPSSNSNASNYRTAVPGQTSKPGSGFIDRAARKLEGTGSLQGEY